MNQLFLLVVFQQKVILKILNYLEKVKLYEHAPPAAWQTQCAWSKLVGIRVMSLRFFAAYIDGFIDRLSNGFVAPKRFLAMIWICPLPQPFNPRDFIIDKLDSGLFIYEYFGHGADLSIAVEIGEVNEYNNYGKYPMMFFSGCRVGNAFGTGVSKGESFVLAKDRGAIGWLAQTDLGYQTFLDEWGRGFNTYFRPKQNTEVQLD